MSNGNIPVFLVEGKNLAETWEKAVLKCWKEGIEIKTEYDKPGDPLSRDCSMTMVCNDPFAEPRIHRAFPAGLEDLEIYRQEVVNGIHDSWICPEEGKWTYTYHQRLFAFEMEGKKVDQINYIIDKLSKAPHTRRAQGITWNPLLDSATDDPPCLQRVWFRILNDETGNPVLNMNTHWRSRDAYKAAYMNIFALTDLQRIVAEEISAKTGKKVKVGRYTDMVDSFHIYGSYFGQFKGFLENIEKRSFEDRTWTSEFAEPMFEEARVKIEAEKRK